MNYSEEFTIEDVIKSRGPFESYLKREVGSKYKKLYPPVKNWCTKPIKPTCSVIEMLASSFVQDGLLADSKEMVFIPYVKGMDSYADVWIKIPEEIWEQAYKNLFSIYRMKKYLYKIPNIFLTFDEGYYFRIGYLFDDMPEPDMPIKKLNYAYQHITSNFESAEEIYKRIQARINEDYYGGLYSIGGRELENAVKDIAREIFEYVQSKGGVQWLVDKLSLAYELLQIGYEKDAQEKIEAEERRKREKEEKIQSYIDWIDNGNPVYSIFGWAYRGASYNEINPDDAIEEIREGRPFEIEYRKVNGCDALVLQYVGENDMY